MPFDDLVVMSRVVGLVLFLALFLGMLAWVFRPGSRRVYEDDAHIPFADDVARKGSHEHD